MATGSRVKVYIETDADQAEAGIKKAESALRRMQGTTTRNTASQSKAATTTSRLNTATGRLSSSLGSAARYAAGAAVAYLSISQAKDAVVVTQDLAKTTAGLARNLGIATEDASRWSAVAKARDVDSKSLTMSFTTLSRRLREARDDTSSSAEAFRSLGLEQKDIAAGNRDFTEGVTRIADAFGEAEGSAKRQAAAQALLGRGYQSLLPMFSEGAKGLEEQMMWADRYGVTMDDKAVKAQMRLVNAQRESKVAMLGLQTSFAKTLTPALVDANKEFQSLSRIMADDDLTKAEKFEKIGAKIEGWADDALDAFVEVLPKIVEKAGEQAPRIAGAFVKGFLDAPALGKLALGGWLFSKMGGFGAGGVLSTGKRLGATFAKGFGPAVAVGLALALTDEDFREQVRNLIAGEPLDAPEIEKVADDVAGWKQNSPDIGWGRTSISGANRISLETAYGQIIFDGTGKVVNAETKKLKTLMGQSLTEVANEFATTGGKFRPFAEQLGGALDKANRSMDSSVKHQGGGLRDLERAFGGTSKKIDRTTKSGWDSYFATTKTGTRDVNNEVGRGNKRTEGEFENTRKKLDGITRKQAQDVGGNVNSMVNKVGVGLGLLGKNTNEALNSFGAKKIHFKIADARTEAGFQRGGPIGEWVGGAGIGDTQPDLMPYGGFVLNKVASAALFGGLQRGGMVPVMLEPGETKWDAATPELMLANELFSRFQKGGKVRHLAAGGVAEPPGDAGSEVVQAAYAPAVGSFLRKWGMDLTQGYNPGGPSVSAGHLSLSAAPSLDVVPLGGDWGGTFLAGLKSAISQGWTVGYGSRGVGESWPNHGEGNHAHIDWGGGTKGVGGAVAEKLKRILLQGPDGPLKSMGQGALDKPWKAAKALIASKMPTGSSGDAPSAGAYKGPLDHTFPQNSSQTISFNQAAMLAEKAGLPGVTYAQIAQGESGLRPGAVSSDGGYGLWQMTPRVQSASTVSAWNKIGSYFNPWNNALQAKHLAGSGTGVSNYYGTGFMTDPNAHYKGPMKFAGGGLVGAQKSTRSDLTHLRSQLRKDNLSNEDRRRLERESEHLKTLIQQMNELISENRSIRRQGEQTSRLNRQEFRKFLAEETGHALGAAASRRALGTAGTGSVASAF